MDSLFRFFFRWPVRGEFPIDLTIFIFFFTFFKIDIFTIWSEKKSKFETKKFYNYRTESTKEKTR